MIETKYKIGDKIDDTMAYGNVTVVDIFISQSKPDQWYCYRVEDSDGHSWLCPEEELVTDDYEEAAD